MKLVWGGEGEGAARGVKTRCPSNPMHVGVTIRRHLKIYDILDPVDVESPGGHISGHEHPIPATTESADCGQPE